MTLLHAITPGGGAPEDDVATRTAASARERPTRDSGTLPRSPGDALRHQEATRLRAMSAPMALGCFAGLIAVPFLDAHPVAITVTMIALAVAAPSYVALFFFLRDPDRVNQRGVAAVSVVQCFAGSAVTYACGIYSLWPGVMAMALYVYVLGAPRTHAVATYACLTLSHAVVALLVLTGTVPDHATFRVVDDLDPVIAWLAQLSILALFAAVFIAARYSRRVTASTVHDLERAVRMVARREALLEEAKQELRAAAWVGGPGRFTEQTFGVWRLGAVLGRGGMGEVYEATSVDSGEVAAVKVLNRGMLARPDAVERFVREARIAASLTVPEVVRFIDVGEDPIPHIVMEKLEGRDLAAVLRERGRLPLAQVAGLIDQVARALDAARDAGIVHRDLKPRNLFLAEPSRSWKVLDFGVSKLMSDEQTLTRSMLVGTPQYMSPEQARGETVDHRTDVYALAVIAYRCATGQSAFTGTEMPRVLHAVAHTMPPRPSALADLPPSLDDVLRVGMAKRADDRFDTARELATALERALRGEPDPSTTARARALDAELSWGAGRRAA